MVRRRRRLGRTVTSVGRTVAPAAGVVVSLLAVNLAGVDVWGAFLGAMILVRLSAQVADFGSRDHLVRVFSREPGALRAAWRRNTAARTWLLALGPVLFLASGSSLATVGAMTVWLVALFVSQSHDALIVYRRAFGFALTLELSAIGLTCVAILAIGAALTADAMILVATGVALLRAIALSVRFRSFGVIALRPAADLDELRASWPFFLLTFTGAVGSRVDLYVVAALLPVAALGEYGLLTNFVLLVQSLSGALLAPIVPSLYRQARAGVLLVSARLFAVGLPLTLLGAVGTWICLWALYDVVLAPLAIGAAWAAMLPCFLYLPLVYLCFRDGRERAVVAGNVLGIAVGLVGTVILAPRLGIAGAMVAAALAQAAIAGFHVVRVLRTPVGRAEVARDALSGM
jgi:O-antigen/teichoic acid export membrane protein